MLGQAMGGTFQYFFTGGINLLLIAFCVVSIGYSVMAEFKVRARQRRQTTGKTVEVES